MSALQELSEARVALTSSGASELGELIIQVLPSQNPRQAGALFVVEDASARAPSEHARVELLEGTEYRYEFRGFESETIRTSRPEVFQADDQTGRTGRLRTGLYTGLLPIQVVLDDGRLSEAVVEVRSKKLEFRSHYRWMLRDIAEAMAEIILERFGTTEQLFSPSASGDARTSYQRFAFLRSLLANESLEAALARIEQRPYIAWQECDEVASAQRGLPRGASLGRQFSRPGQRVRAAVRNEREEPLNVPAHLTIRRAVSSLDNIPNRFVRLALEAWRNDVAGIRDDLRAVPASASVTRGIEETDAVLTQLERHLASSVVREAGRLAAVPAGNIVLLQRDGYKDIFRVFLISQLAAQLAWGGGEDVYSAGQRNVATLYEFWAFLQLAAVVSELCDEPLDLSRLVEDGEGGLSLCLKRGTLSMVTGSLSRLGRRLAVELCFNRTFAPGFGQRSAWSRRMRPDCSLCFRQQDGQGREVWLHFDAKYRVDALTELFGGGDEGEEVMLVSSANARTDDLLKMHAYRDGIRSSAGAYVLYPGEGSANYLQYHEILPGLGAFPLRPSSHGSAEGSPLLREFLELASTHLASQGTQHERGLYWAHVAHSAASGANARVREAKFLERPPADTKVLLGFVKSAAHLKWIVDTGQYNLRADERTGQVGLSGDEASAEVVVLYGDHDVPVSIWIRTGPLLLRTREDLLSSGYPEPRGGAYLCVPLSPVSEGDWRPELSRALVDRLIGDQAANALIGVPFVVTWLELARRTASASGP